MALRLRSSFLDQIKIQIFIGRRQTYGDVIRFLVCYPSHRNVPNRIHPIFGSFLNYTTSMYVHVILCPVDPLWVRLLGENRPMSADQSYEVSCEVVGARPAPIVSWWKGAEPQRNTRESVRTLGLHLNKLHLI